MIAFFTSRYFPVPNNIRVLCILTLAQDEPIGVSGFVSATTTRKQIWISRTNIEFNQVLGRFSQDLLNSTRALEKQEKMLAVVSFSKIKTLQTRTSNLKQWCIYEWYKFAFELHAGFCLLYCRQYLISLIKAQCNRPLRNWKLEKEKEEELHIISITVSDSLCYSRPSREKKSERPSPPLSGNFLFWGDE